MDSWVEEAIVLMNQHATARFSVEDVAQRLFISPFHFSRMFRQHTGITPGRYLTTVRLSHAQRLLLTTSLRVADISAEVGYASVGTFTTRFSETVGTSPARFRLLKGDEAVSCRQAGSPFPPARLGSITGSVTVQSETPTGRIFIGLFDEPLAQGMPAGGTILERPGLWSMPHVPAKTWWVLAAAVVADAQPSPVSSSCTPLLVARAGPVTVRREGASVDLVMRRPEPSDPPVLVALPGIHQALFRSRRPGMAVRRPAC